MSGDENLLVHVGRNDFDRLPSGIMAQDVFLTAYANGIHIGEEKSLFMPGVRSRVQEEALLRLISESAIVVALTEASPKSAELLLGQRIAHMLVIPQHNKGCLPIQARVDGKPSQGAFGAGITLFASLDRG